MHMSVCVAFQTEGKLYLILDFLRGGDLFTRLSKEVGVLLILCLLPHTNCICHHSLVNTVLLENVTFYYPDAD